MVPRPEVLTQLLRWPQFKCGYTRCDVEPLLGLHAERLQHDRLRRTTDERIGTDADTHGRFSRDATIIS